MTIYIYIYIHTRRIIERTCKLLSGALGCRDITSVVGVQSSQLFRMHWV